MNLFIKKYKNKPGIYPSYNCDDEPYLNGFRLCFFGYVVDIVFNGRKE